MAAKNEDVAVWKNDCIGKDPLCRHAANSLDTGDRGRGADSNDMGSIGGASALIVRRSAEGENFASDSVIHDSITAHGISVSGASAHTCLAAGSRRAIPIHRLARTPLENVAVLPAEKPTMIVLTEDALRVVGEHRGDRATGE